jgi:hypothetical protein
MFKIAVFLSTLLGAPFYQFIDAGFEFTTSAECYAAVTSAEYRERLMDIGANYAMTTGEPNSVTAYCESK